MKLKYKSRAGIKSPTSLSFENNKTPRLSGDNDIEFTLYTTKNISSKTKKHPQQYNMFINGKLAYKRAPRGSGPDYPTKIIWGPSVHKLTKNNYNKLKKNQLIYMDRDSIHFRGPIIFNRLLRGPKLHLSAKDRGYDDVYDFILDVKNIKDFQLYVVESNSSKKKTRSRTKNKSRSRSNKTRKFKKKKKKKFRKKTRKRKKKK